MVLLKSIAIGVFNTVVGFVGLAIIADYCVRWYRISSFEGGSGYFAVLLAILGGVVGFVLGIILALFAFRSGSGFAKAMGLSVGTTIVLLALTAACAWLAADHPPRIDGKKLVVEFEIRCPEGITLPENKKTDGSKERWYAFITRDHGNRSVQQGGLRTSESRKDGTRWIIPVTVDLQTSDPGKSLGIVLGNREPQFFNLPIPAKPDRSSMEWSEWMPGPTFGNLDKIPATERVAVRYRVQFYVPPPPPPSYQETLTQRQAADEAAVDALPQAAPIAQWLQFTDDSKPKEVRERAAAKISHRPDVERELSELVLSSDRQASDLALDCVAIMNPPPAGVAAAVNEAGRKLADEIRFVNTVTPEADPSYEHACEALARFYAWNGAARALHEQRGINMLPAMQELLTLARVREDSIAMQDLARISGYYVEKWRGGVSGTAK